MNVFLVLSPLQVINALEAKAFFGTQDNTLIVLRHTSQGYPISMFKRLISEADWDRVHYLSTYGEERITRINKYYWALLSLQQQRRLEQLAAALGRAEGLFIGLYHEPLARHFSNVLPHQTLYLLDDGTDTFSINEVRKRPASSAFLQLASSRMSLLSKLLRLKDQQGERATFFTVYDLEVRPGDTLIKNHYHHFRARMSDVPVTDEVWFLGGPLVLDGYISETVYARYLERMKYFYRDKKLVYLPHSREQQTDVERIQTLLDCEVRRYGLPVELALSRANPRPEELVSFITSALTNCHTMFGATLKLTSVYLEPQHLLKHAATVGEIYRQFYREADAGFRVLTREQLAPVSAAD